MKIHPPYPKYHFFRETRDLFSKEYAIDLSILAYSDKAFATAHAAITGYDFYFIQKPLFQCLVLRDAPSKRCLVAFRGTVGIKDWEVDFEVKKNDLGFHEGFYSAAFDFVDDLEPLVADCDTRFSGHSLGAAMGAIAAFLLKGCCKSAEIINFGQPKIGDQAAVDRLSKISWTRYVHGCDLVPEVPLRCMDYVHGGYEVLLPQVKRHWWQMFSREKPYIIPLELWDHIPTLYAKRIWES